MNGVRRLFENAVNTVAISGTTTQTALSPTRADPPPNISPLVINSGKVNWPPNAPVSARRPTASPPASPAKSAATSPLLARIVREDPEPSSKVRSPSTRQRTTSTNNRSPPPPTTNAPMPSLTRLRSPPPRSGSVGSSSRNASATLNARDELLMSLLSSEAVVDSRDFEILGSEDVDDLKREQELLIGRMTALTKKVALETKIRDATTSLSRLNSSKQPSEQLEAANRKVDAVQRDLARIAERYNEVQRRLLEHRAGVLSFSVRSLEQQLRPQQPNDPMSGRITPVGSREISPTSTGNSVSAVSRPRFEGAHLYAGHADAVSPRTRGGPAASQTQVTELEEKLKAAEEALEAARTKEAELVQDMNQLQQDQLGDDRAKARQLQSAEDTIANLEREAKRLGPMEEQVRDLLDAKARWERDKRRLEEQAESAQSRSSELERKLEDVQTEVLRNNGKVDQSKLDEALAEARTQRRVDVEAKDAEIRGLRTDHAAEIGRWASQKASWEREKLQYEQQLAGFDLERAAWLKEKDTLNDEKLDDLARLQQEMDHELQAARMTQDELDSAKSTLLSAVRLHGIRTSLGELDVPSLAASVMAHLDDQDVKMQDLKKDKESWQVTRRKLEDDFRSGMEARERLGHDLETARREREDARKELRSVEERFRDQADRLSDMSSVRAPSAATTLVEKELQEEYDRVLTSLRSIWVMLPSVEARAAKLPSTPSKLTAVMPKSPLLSPRGGFGEVQSISELDVRGLKSLYDPRGFQSPGLAGTFSVDSLVTRIQGLIDDDKSIIERLIRFAQAHDLLKNNAERAQKLAQESSLGLDTYQKQLQTLEARNKSLISKQTSLTDEVLELRDQVFRLEKQKGDLEIKANEQAELCRSLQEANNTLSARTLTLAEEAANAPEVVRIKMETQLSDTRNQLYDVNTKLAKAQKSLTEAQDEIEGMRKAESGQLNALMDELNSMQTQNTTLRNQLRSAGIRL